MTFGEKLQRLRRARGWTLGLLQWFGPWLWRQGKRLLRRIWQ